MIVLQLEETKEENINKKKNRKKEEKEEEDKKKKKKQEKKKTKKKKKKKSKIESQNLVFANVLFVELKGEGEGEEDNKIQKGDKEEEK